MAKQKPILGYWIYAESRKPVFVIDAMQLSVLDYHFSKAEVIEVQMLVNVCKEERRSLSFDPNAVSVEVVFDVRRTPSIALIRSVEDHESRSWMNFDAKAGYDNFLAEGSLEPLAIAFDYCFTEGQARLHLTPNSPIFPVRKNAVGGRLGRHEEESE